MPGLAGHTSGPAPDLVQRHRDSRVRVLRFEDWRQARRIARNRDHNASPEPGHSTQSVPLERHTPASPWS